MYWYVWHLWPDLEKNIVKYSRITFSKTLSGTSYPWIVNSTAAHLNVNEKRKKIERKEKLLCVKLDVSVVNVILMLLRAPKYYHWAITLMGGVYPFSPAATPNLSPANSVSTSRSGLRKQAKRLPVALCFTGEI